MLNYYVQIAEVKNNCIGRKYGIINYETETSVIDDVEQDKLIKEIVSNENIKKIFPDADTYLVLELMPTYAYLEKINKTNEELYKTTKDNWENTMNSEEVQIRRLHKNYKDVLSAVEFIVKETEEKNQKDSQEYLNFLDELNKVSVSH